MSEYSGILLTFLFAGAIAGTFIFLATVLGPKRPSPAKSEPFECGMRPFQLPAGRLTIRYYLVAMLFILFDVELVFLFPWAVVFRGLGFYGFVTMAIFLGILLVGFVYAWKKGALEWQ
ncbi:MAG: NADH-quinone oxidoreductase subunit A [Candidatus Omnitrophica bacterium]|nr:NADH-quinone oxidoreductase subunit A [Candidatus Omnitrophota bacterium]